MPVSNPIPSSQVVDINVDWTCGVEPACATLDNVLQAIITEVCTKEDIIDLNDLTFDTCFNNNVVPSNTTELLQAIVDDIVTLNCPDVEAPDVDISGLNLCDTDGWNCGTLLQCLFITDNCGNPVVSYTLKELVQTMIKRMLAYQVEICALEDRIETLETNYTTLLSRMDVIEATCCNITLIDRIVVVEDAINTPTTGVLGRLDTIEATCCP